MVVGQLAAMLSGSFAGLGSPLSTACWQSEQEQWIEASLGLSLGRGQPMIQLSDSPSSGNNGVNDHLKQAKLVTLILERNPLGVDNTGRRRSPAQV